MSDLCHFCMVKEATRKVDGGQLGSLGQVSFCLCPECADEKLLADKRNSNLLELQHNDLSKLCVGCGICCFILHAKVTHAEADRIVEENKICKDDFAIETEIGKSLYPDNYTIKTPCMFLLGRPLGEWTACRIHGKFRPEVCRTYMCKIAIRYQIGTVSLGEAKYALRSAVLTKDLSIFNWSSNSDQEAKLLLSFQLASRVRQLRKDNLSEEDIKMAMASWVTPRYTIKSVLDELVLDMHLATHDRGDDDPLVFFSKEELANLRQLEPSAVIGEVITRVLDTIRGYFVCDKRHIEGMPKVDEEKAEELKGSSK